MIYFTGDTHGSIEKLTYFVKKHALSDNDIIVVLGDAGFNYYGNTHGDAHIKKKVNQLGVTVFCIHGNHEQRPEAISSYSISSWRGGAVFVEQDYPNLLFAKDGEVYDLDGHKALVLGGAYSVDKYYRLLKGYHWFENEQPDEEIKAHAAASLEKLDWKIDTVLSHTCTYKYIPREAFLPGIDQTLVDNSTEIWLDTIEDKLIYKQWLCGHWHIDKQIDKIRFLMDDFISLTEITNDSKK